MHYFNVPYTVLALLLLQCSLSVPHNYSSEQQPGQPAHSQKAMDRTQRLHKLKRSIHHGQDIFLQCPNFKMWLIKANFIKAEETAESSIFRQTAVLQYLPFPCCQFELWYSGCGNMCSNKMNIYYFAFTSQYSVSLIAPNWHCELVTDGDRIISPLPV